MGKITKKEIKKLVKVAKEDLGDLIEQELINKIGTNPIVYDSRIEIELDANNSPTEPFAASTQCFYICITIGGVRYCWQYCIQKSVTGFEGRK